MISDIVAVLVALLLFVGASRIRGACRTCGMTRTVVHDSYGTSYIACPSCHYSATQVVNA